MLSKQLVRFKIQNESAPNQYLDTFKFEMFSSMNAIRINSLLSKVIPIIAEIMMFSIFRLGHVYEVATATEYLFGIPCSCASINVIRIEKVGYNFE